MKANGFYDGCMRIVRQGSLKGRQEGSERKKAGSGSNCQFLRKAFFSFFSDISKWKHHKHVGMCITVPEF